MTPDGSLVAASGTNIAGQPFLAAWDGTTGRLLFPVAASLASAANSPAAEQRRSPEPPLRSPPAAFPTTALALTPDGSLLAAGTDDGEVTVWRVSNVGQRVSSDAPAPGSRGRESAPTSPVEENDQRRLTSAATEPLAQIRASRLPIRSLAFGRDYVRDPLHPAPEPQWLLASGDDGGGVVIWELPGGTVRNRCRGSQYNRDSHAFSPDGTLLASGGRTPTFVCDTATGDTVLTLAEDFVVGIAFSADGTKLTTTQARGYGLPTTAAWGLANGRGIRTLRGLASPAPHVWLSPDGHSLAAVSHAWQVGLWDMPSGHLRHVFNMPRGAFDAGNSYLAFSHDGSQFAFMAGTNAMLIDARTGLRTNNWNLPVGRMEQLALDSQGRLLALHLESLDRTATHPSITKPRVARIRELLPNGNLREMTELTEFNNDVRYAHWANDASSVLVEGSHYADVVTNRFVRVVRPDDGSLLWSRPSSLETYTGEGSMPDAAGQFLALNDGTVEGNPLYFLREAQTGRERRPLVNPQPALMHSTADYLCIKVTGGFALCALSDETLLVNLQPVSESQSSRPKFSLDGRLLAWGNEDGTVTVCDLDEMNHRLAALRLGW